MSQNNVPPKYSAPTDATDNNIGARIKRYRQALYLSQQYVASKLAISPSAYSRIESGQRKVSAEMILALSDLLGVSADMLLCEAKTEETRAATFIAEFNSLSPHDQAEIMSLIRFKKFMYGMDQQRKNE